MRFVVLAFLSTVFQLQEPVQDGRMAEPPAARQREAEKRMRDIFKDDYALRGPEASRALAAKLIRYELEIQDGGVFRYVRFREARDLAAGAGAAPLALRALDLLAREYRVDLSTQASSVLKTLERTVSTPSGFRALAEACRTSADVAVALEDVESAARFLSASEQAAKQVRDPRLAQVAQARAKDVAELRRELPRVRVARKALEEKPDDPAANLTVGRFLCLVKGAWAEGLPRLAKGTDDLLRRAAEAELSAPKEGESQAAVGDAWWAAGEKQGGPVRERAFHWYRTAWPGVAGTTRERLRSRFKSTASRGPIRPPGDMPPGLGADDVVRKHAGSDDSRSVSGSASFLIQPSPMPLGWRVESRPMVRGRTYLFSAWVQSEDSAGGVIAQVVYTTADATPVGTAPIFAPADQPWWGRLEARAAIPVEAVTVQVEMYAGYLKGGRAWIDDLSLKDEDGEELITNGGFEK